MDGVVAFKVHGDLSWDGAGCWHAAHTLTALLPAMLSIPVVFIHSTSTLWISNFFGGKNGTFCSVPGNKSNGSLGSNEGNQATVTEGNIYKNGN